MHLTPRERERLLLAAAADLARRRLARGAPLGSTEAVALVCDEICELAWDGLPLTEVIGRARTVVPPDALLPGVAGLVPVIEVEALFPWGSTLVHVDAPFGPGQDPGPVLPGAGTIALAPGAERRTAVLRNTGTRDVWVSSHYPLSEVNPAVRIWLTDAGEAAFVRDDGSPGSLPWCRLDLPAGEALLVRAAEERTVSVVTGAADDRA